MLITYLRSSSYNNEEFCQNQYFIDYVLGYKHPSNKAAEKGTIVHKVMEILGNLKKAQQDNNKYIVDEICGKVDVCDINNAGVVNNIFWKVYQYYCSISKHKFYPKDFKDCKLWTWDALNFNNGILDSRKRNIVATEQHFDIEIPHEWAKYEYEINGKKIIGQLRLKGTIDLITEIKPLVYEVIDFKTGARKNWATGAEKDFDALSKDPQLKIYNYAIQHLYPDLKSAMFTIFFIKDGGPFTVCFEKGLEDAENMLRAKFEKIKNNVLPHPNKTEKCARMCAFYKPSKQDPTQSMCDYIHNRVLQHGMERVVVEDSNVGHNIDTYNAPGGA